MSAHLEEQLDMQVETDQALLHKRIQEHITPELEEYFEVDLELRKIKEDSKELVKRKKELEDSIKKCMEENNIHQFKTQNGYIRKEERNTPKSLNKDIMKEYIGRQIDENTAEKLVEELFKNRPVERKVNLKLANDDGEGGGRKKRRGGGGSSRN